MKKASVVQLVAAAIVVVLGGLALCFAGEKTLRVEVEQGAADQVKVVTDGATQVLRLSDLAEGQERSFGTGEHQVVVKRLGGRLEVTLDGKALCCGEGDETDESLVVVGGDKVKVQKKVVVVTSGDDDSPESAYRFRVASGDDCAGEMVKVIRVGGGGDLSLPVNMADPERVVFRCADDGTVLRIAKDKATQDSYTCPVCGKPMAKAKASEVRVMTVITEDKDKDTETKVE